MTSQLKSAGKALLFLSAFFAPETLAIGEQLNTSTCTSVEVTGAEGNISGTYIYDGPSYVRSGGSTSFILGQNSIDQWFLGQGASPNSVIYNYPFYYTSDTSEHPVDVVETWQLVTSADSEGDAPSGFSITCTASSGNSTASPTGVPITTCTVDIPCPGDTCCHPVTNTCGRTLDFCRMRSGKKMCCTQDTDWNSADTTGSCFEDDICEEIQQPVGIFEALGSSGIVLLIICCGIYWCCCMEEEIVKVRTYRRSRWVWA